MAVNRSFTSTDPVSHKGETNTWFTPKWILDKLGPFDLDPCTQTFRPFDTAGRHVCEDAGGDGLAEPWIGRVWLNPPYGKHTGLWLDKMARHKNGVALVFNRLETTWGQKALAEADAVLFLKCRVSFLPSSNRKETNAGCGSILLAYGARNVEALRRLDGILMVVDIFS